MPQQLPLTQEAVVVVVVTVTAMVAMVVPASSLSLTHHKYLKNHNGIYW
jgi:hypothetical protein